MAAEGLLEVCRPVALDLRGHGDSQTELPVGAWTEMAKDIERLAAAEGWREFVIVGHSLGGAVGILLGERRPELLSALVLVEAPLRPNMGERGPSKMVETALRRRYEWPSREEAAAHLRARAPYDSWHPEVFAGFVETGLRARDGAGGAVELACRRENEAAVFEGDPPGGLWALLPRVQCPVWVGRGTGSRGFGSSTDPDTAAQLRDAREWLAEGGGHFVPLGRPEWMQAIVRDALAVLDEEDGSGDAAGSAERQ